MPEAHRQRPRGVLLVAALLLAACGAKPSGEPAPTGGTIPIGTLPPTVATTSPHGEPTTAAPSTTAPDPVPACVQAWPLRDRIALLVWPSVYANAWSTATKAVADLHVGGVVLMKPDDAFAADLATHLGELDAVSPHGVLVATDEEGGAVQRLRALGVLPSQEQMSAQDDASITATVEEHAKVIADAGIDVVLGPVVDVRPVKGSDPLGEGRLFVGGPDRVAHLGGLYVRGWQSAGLLPVLKHFPGHGSASADTHQQLATTPPLDELRSRDLVPYEQLAGSGAAVMVGHLAVPGLTDGEPASRSAAAIALLRGERGYPDALVMTDALGMGAVGLSVPDAAVRSLQAGVDVVIFTDTGQTAGVIDAIEAAVNAGTITTAAIDEHAVRVARVLTAHGAGCSGAG